MIVGRKTVSNPRRHFEPLIEFLHGYSDQDGRFIEIIDILRNAASLTTPPARSYADGVEDAAKVSENLCADMTVEANAETASLTSTLHRASAQTAGKIAAAIRLLSQGEKA